jgi:hypothetical protein
MDIHGVFDPLALLSLTWGCILSASRSDSEETDAMSLRGLIYTFSA